MIWDIKQIISYLQKFKPDTYFEIFIFDKKRSLNQNDYYRWVVVKIISNFSWDSPWSVHEFLKNEFIISSTTNLSSFTFEEYLDEIRWWAFSFLWLYIPEPNSLESIQTYETLKKEKFKINI